MLIVNDALVPPPRSHRGAVERFQILSEALLYALAHLKSWKILQDCRRKATGSGTPREASRSCATSQRPADRPTWRTGEPANRPRISRARPLRWPIKIITRQPLAALGRDEVHGQAKLPSGTDDRGGDSQDLP